MSAFFATFILVLSSAFCFGQEWLQPVTGSYMAAEVYAAQKSNALATMSNPAALPLQQQHSIGFLGEHRFALAELKFFSAAAAMRTKYGGFGASICYSGNAGSNLTNFSLAYGRRINTIMSVGASLHYLRLGQQQVYGNAQAFSVGFGMHVQPVQQFALTLYSFNPFRAGWTSGEGQGSIPALYRFGAGYQVSEKLLLTTELVKEEDFPVSVRGIADYAIVPALRFKLGVGSGNNSLIAGVAVNWRGFRIDVLAAYHQQLGFSPASALLVPFGKNEADLPE